MAPPSAETGSSPSAAISPGAPASHATADKAESVRGEAGLKVPGISAVKRLLRSAGPVQDILSPAKGPNKRQRQTEETEEEEEEEEQELSSTLPDQALTQTEGANSSGLQQQLSVITAEIEHDDRLVCIHFFIKKGQR